MTLFRLARLYRRRVALGVVTGLALMTVVNAVWIIPPNKAFTANKVHATSTKVAQINQKRRPADVDFGERGTGLAPGGGSLNGKVVSQETGLPLPGVFVHFDDQSEISDEAGLFTMEILNSAAITVEASRPDMITSRQFANVVSGNTTNITFRLAKAAPPCCRLEGNWHLTLVLDRGSPTVANAKILTGTVRFRSALWGRFFGHVTSEIYAKNEFGDYDVDLRPFFGEDFERWVMQSEGWGASNMLKEASGAVRSGDLVDIQFVPRLSHGGLDLDGKISKNGTIRGIWLRRSYAPTLGGHFIMTRI
jgi:hypothetical protein